MKHGATTWPPVPIGGTILQSLRQHLDHRYPIVLVRQWNDDVATLARLHSHNMADGRFFSHRGSDGSMVDDRADRLGLGAWRLIGENIAYMRGYEDPAALAVEKWMESTAHRKNLLGPNWKESAVGVAITEDGTYYMTQVFLLRK